VQKNKAFSELAEGFFFVAGRLFRALVWSSAFLRRFMKNPRSADQVFFGKILDTAIPVMRG